MRTQEELQSMVHLIANAMMHDRVRFVVAEYERNLRKELSNKDPRELASMMRKFYPGNKLGIVPECVHKFSHFKFHVADEVTYSKRCEVCITWHESSQEEYERSRNGSI